jgi:cytochrome P450
MQDSTSLDNLLYDPRDPAVMANPFPAYSRLQTEDPVHWNPVLKSWVITRYADVRSVLLHDAMSVNKLNAFYQSLPPIDAARMRDIVHYLNLWVAFQDPPQHTRMRTIMRKAFMASSFNSMESDIASIVNQLLGDLHGRDRIDFITDFALLVPAYVIMDLLGVPRDRLSDIKAWADDMAVFIAGARNADDKYARAERGCKNMAGFFRELITDCRADAGSGFLTDLINADDSGDALTDDELIATCILILFAGHETTTNLIGNSLLTLLKHPNHFTEYKANPAINNLACEELMRFDGPSNGLVRTVTKDHPLGDKTLKAGDRVYVMLNAANRDPEVFDQPDTLILDRKPNRHLVFGTGIHTCLGVQLARQEGRIALRSFADRFPVVSLIDDESPVWQDAMVPRGMKSLPISLNSKTA